MVVNSFICKYATGFYAFLALGCWSPSRADNWPHFRGEGGNGISSTANPPTVLSRNENLKWSVPIPGRGSSSPIIWEDKIFVTTATRSATTERALDFHLICLSRDSGKVIWQKIANTQRPHEGTHSTNGYASGSPCTDGEHVFAFFGSFGLFCFDFDGEIQWSKTDFGQMRMRNQFGEGSSPALTVDSLIVPWDHEGQSALYRIDKVDGSVVWKVNRDEPTNWGTPLVVENGQQKQVIQTGQQFVRGYDYESGKEIWSCGGQTQRPAASPIADDGMVYVGSGHRGAFMAAFDLNGSGNIAKTEHVHWTINRNTPDIASPLLSDGKIFFYKAKSGLLSCVDAKTGKPHFSAKRIRDLDYIYASPVAAGGHIYMSDRDGTVIVAKDSTNLEIVSVNDLGETIDATPALAGNQIIIRGEKTLFCFE